MGAEFVQRGRLCVEQGQLQEAVRVCRLGLLANPGEVEGRVVLGSALMALARFDEVLGEMKSALDMAPGNPSALALQGEALLRKGDALRAVVVLDQAALQAPGDPYVEQLRTEAAAAAANGPSPLLTVDIDPELEGVEIREEDIAPMEVSADDLIEMDSDILESDILEPEIEELDADLLMEATPTPMPMSVALPQPSKHSDDGDGGPFQDMRGTRVGGETLEAAPETLPETLPELAPETLPARAPQTLAVEAPETLPIDDPWSSPDALSEIPMARLPVMDAPTPEPARGHARIERPRSVPDRAESSIFEFDDDDDDDDEPLAASPARLETIGTLFPDDDDDEPSASRPATIGTLFPDDEITPSPAPAARTADMDVIRHGFSEPAAPVNEPQMPSQVPGFSAPGISGPGISAPGMSAPPPMEAPIVRSERRRETATATGRGSKPPRKTRGVRKIPKAAWGALALLAIAGGAGGGLKVREARLARQVRTANSEITALLRDDSYLGHRKARDWIGRIHGVQKSDASLARLAAAEARLAGEFGDDAKRAKALFAEIKDTASASALEASAYLALADGDVQVALDSAQTLVAGKPDAWAGHYLLARALILSENGDAAKESIDRAITLSPTLLSYVVLARAEALRSRYPESIAALGRATSISEEHPIALIWQARILVEAGELPKNPSDPDDALANITKRSRNGGDVSLAQGAWAGLVLAEIKLQRGDVAAAKKALAEAKVGRPTGWMFSEMLADVLIRLGEFDLALEEAERASELWPGRAKPRVSRARIRLSQGDPNAALEVLDEVQGIENLPEALTVRGRAQLHLGKLAEAATDLDRALTMRPRFADAVIARAQVDILKGQAKSAIGRLEPMYDKTAGPELAVAYAAALRTSGKPREAREVLAPISGSDGTLIAIIELARLERSEGRYEEARNVFARAMELAPESLEAQLGAAELDIDDGRVKEGREALDALIEEGTRNGRVLLAGARARTLDGDTLGATELLDQVDAAWLGWLVARERGRILLNRLTPIEAISELQRAQSLRPDDTDTRLLLMEAHFEARNQRGSARALEEITKSFRKAPIRATAAGLHALLTDRATDAIASFNEARSLLIDTKGSRLELAQVAYWLGRSYNISGDLRQAAEWLEKATKLNSSHALAYFWAGQVQHQDEKIDKMVASYEKAVALDPGIAPMAWFFLGSHYSANGKPDEAIRALEMFLQYYPENSGDMVVEAKVLLAKLR
mgnify:FL=1